MRTVLKIVVLLLTIVLLFSSCSKKIVFRAPVTVDYVWYTTPQKLVDRADVVVLARVTDISFRAMDDSWGEYVTEETDPSDVRIYTIYHLDEILVYKGERSYPAPLRVRIKTGYPGYQEEEQWKLLKKARKDKVEYIHVMEEFEEVRCEIGKTYLFMLGDISRRELAILPPLQAIYKIEDPTRTQGPFNEAMFSAKDIIMEFGEDQWNDFYARWEKGEFEPISVE